MTSENGDKTVPPVVRLEPEQMAEIAAIAVSMISKSGRSLEEGSKSGK